MGPQLNLLQNFQYQPIHQTHSLTKMFFLSPCLSLLEVKINLKQMGAGKTAQQLGKLCFFQRTPAQFPVSLLGRDTAFKILLLKAGIHTRALYSPILFYILRDLAS